jgi:hypothetical protein
MKSTAGRAVLLAVLAAAAIVLFIVLSGGDDDGDSTTGTVATTATTVDPEFDVITMKDGAPVGGVQELEYSKGDEIRIEVRLDEPQEELHLHGYDLEKANPSGTVRFQFPAKIDGIFELEAHGPSGDVQLTEIVVNP